MHRIAGTQPDRGVDRNGERRIGGQPAGAAAAEARRATIWIDRAIGAATGGMAKATLPPVGETPQPARAAGLTAALTLARPAPVRIDLAEVPRLATFDDLALAAIVCDPAGRILSMSQAATMIVADGGALARTGDRLIAHDVQGHARLRAALVHCSTALDDDDERITLALTGADGLPVRIDVAPLHQPGGVTRCVVLLTENRPGGRAVEQLVSAFGLTRAEAEVAIDLAHGLSAREIAERRSASSDTVRKQTQAIFQKLGVAKATRLAFVLGPFLR